MENVNRVETLSPILKNVFSDPSPASKAKIEAYIDAVYEQAMKERDDRDKNLWTEDEFANFNDPKDRFRERINDGRSLIHGSAIVSDSENPIAKLRKLKGEREFRNSWQDNRKFLEPEERDRSANFSKSSGNREEARDRSRGAARLENTFDYTPTFLAIQSSRIPQGSQFSRQTQRNVFSNGSLATTVEFFIPLRSDTNETINRHHHIAPSTMKSDGFEFRSDALSSKTVIFDTHDQSTKSGGPRVYGFRTPESSGNVNLRNTLAERRNSSSAAFRNGNARSGEEMEVENANVSTRISTVSAFTRLRNLSSSSSFFSSSSSSSIGISRLEELPALTARPGDKSSTEIHESRTRSSLLANEVLGFSDEFGNLYEGRESRTIYYSSPEQETPKNVNLKNSYKFWKSLPRSWKLRKSKGAEKFRGDKDESSKRGYEKSSSSRELIWKKRGSPDFKRDTSRNVSSRRSRRHLRIENEDSDSAMNENFPEDSRRYARSKVVYSKRKTSEIRGNESPKKQVILESDHSYKKVRSKEGDNSFFFNKENGKENNVDKRIEDKFARISNVLKEDSAAVRIIQQTPENLKAATRSKDIADISRVQAEPRDDSFLRKDDKSYESVPIREATSEYPAELIDTRQQSIMNENVVAKSKKLSLKDDSIDYEESASLQPREKLSATVLGPFLSSHITRKLSHNVSKEANLNESTSPICTNTFAMKQTGVFASKLSSETPRRNVNFAAVEHESLSTVSGSWTNSKETTVYPEAWNNRSESVRDENARFLELNNDPSRMIAGNFTGRPRGSPIEADLSLRGSGSITEPTEASPGDDVVGGEEDSRYIRDPLQENSVGIIPRSEDSTARSQGSRERDKIADLVDRIVRQYAAYTPLMPNTMTFDEVTEAETLPPKVETVGSITTLGTSTKVMDATFRTSIRPPLVTPVLSREMHDEISLDESTFADETEATTLRKKFLRTRRPDMSFVLKGKVRISSDIGKSKERQKTVNCLANMIDVKGRVKDHPWYRTTKMPQIIVANDRSEPGKIKGERKKQRYKSDYFPNASSTTISFSVADDLALAQTRNRRSDFIRDRDSSIFYDYDEERDKEDRAQDGRTALSEDGKSSDMTKASSELRAGIGKGLAGEFNYSANWKSFPQSRESREQTQKHNNGSSNSSPRDSLKKFALLRLRRVKDDAFGRFDVISRSREAISASLLEIPFPAEISTSRKEDLSGSMGKRSGTDRRTSERRGFDERAKVDRIARKIALENLRTAKVDDLSNCNANPARLLTDCGKSSGDQDDKGRQTDPVIRGAKLMIADDRDVVAAKDTDKKIPSTSHGAKHWKRKDARRKINENRAKNPRVYRAFIGEEHLRPCRGEVYDGIERRKSSSDDRARRSGRRLLSTGKFSYSEDEYYQEEGSEVDGENDSASDNEAIARRNDLSDQPVSREDRDSRKLLPPETDRLADESADPARTLTPEERTIAVSDTRMVIPDVQRISEQGAISRFPLISHINYDILYIHFFFFFSMWYSII